jgi:plasmid stability protein
MEKATIHLPKDLHRALKVRAAEEDTTVQALAEKVLAKYLGLKGRSQ